MAHNALFRQASTSLGMQTHLRSRSRGLIVCVAVAVSEVACLVSRFTSVVLPSYIWGRQAQLSLPAPLGGQHFVKRTSSVYRYAAEMASAAWVVQPAVEKLGLKFVSLPPGKVIIKEVTPGMWAAEQGVTVGAELAEINGQQVATMSKEEFMHTMSERPISMQMNVDPRELTRELTSATSALSVLVVIAPWVGGLHFNDIHMSAAFHRLAVHRADIDEKLTGSPVLKELIQRTRAAFQSGAMNVRAGSNLLWSLGRLHKDVMCWGIISPELKSLIAPITASLIDQADAMEPLNIVNCFWSAAVFKQEVPHVCALPLALLDSATREIPNMTPRQLATVVWGTGILQLDGEKVKHMLDLMRKELAVNMGSCNTQDLANACLGFGMLNIRDESLMRLISAKTVQGMQTWSKKQIMFDFVEIIWAHAKLGFQSGELLDAAAKVFAQNICDLTDWSLCALLWSYLKLDADKSSIDFRRRLVAEVTRRGFDSGTVSAARVGPHEWMTKG